MNVPNAPKHMIEAEKTTFLCFKLDFLEGPWRALLLIGFINVQVLRKQMAFEDSSKDLLICEGHFWWL